MNAIKRAQNIILIYQIASTTTTTKEKKKQNTYWSLLDDNYFRIVIKNEKSISKKICQKNPNTIDRIDAFKRV